jgi:hypothetical protein
VNEAFCSLSHLIHVKHAALYNIQHISRTSEAELTPYVRGFVWAISGQKLKLTYYVGRACYREYYSATRGATAS